MKGNTMLDMIENLDPAYIEAAAVPKAKKPFRLKGWGAIAACLVILFSVGIGTYTYAAEAKEYHDAIKFFNDYDLSTRGLTRAEIKKIYRDITTESFSYTKTAEVIANSLTSDQIGGFEILQEKPTPADFKFYYPCRISVSNALPASRQTRRWWAFLLRLGLRPLAFP